jgi:hypothetical protein
MTYNAFDDSRTIQRAPKPTGSGSAFPYDHLRQGVEINVTKHLYVGTQPKLWAGANNFNDIDVVTDVVTHQVNVVTYGQALGFIQFEGSSSFKDLPKFDPTSYITLGDDYPLPIVLNDGPMQQQEAIIEPFTIPFRLPTNEGPIYAHRVHAELEDGNNFLDPRRTANRVQQFVELEPPSTPVFFLDMGQEEFGGIRIDGFITATQRLTHPFDDTELEVVANSARTNDSNFTNQLIAMDVNNDDDLRPFKQKSATAGFVFSNANNTGTDSIAFGGTFRGV